MGCSYSMQRLPIDISYAEAIAQAEISDEYDQRIELNASVRNWKYYPEREVMLKKVFQMNLFDSLRYVILEIGNSGFGSYYYAYIWETSTGVRMITNISNSKGRSEEHTSELQSPTN